MKLLVATRSGPKMREIRRILADVLDLRLVDLDAAGLPPEKGEDALERFETFEENAAAKATHFRRRSGLATVADDSGLEVDALGGLPGVRTKRFAPVDGLDGEALDRANNEHLLRRLQDVPLSQRTARYVCVAALDTGDGEDVRLFRGEAPGLILALPRGRGGFGYDPLFYDRGLGKTFAEIPADEKNRRSHRGAAFRALARHLQAGGGRSWLASSTAPPT